MNKKKISGAVRMVALVLAIALFLPVSAQAVEPRSSLYLDAYGAYTYRAGWGKIQIWFDVQATNDMDELGVLEIQMYESRDNETWTWVETFKHYDTPGMLTYNDYHHAGHVEYNGTIGRYYKAYVCVWAGKNGGGDNRYFWTSAQKATLFAE